MLFQLFFRMDQTSEKKIENWINFNLHYCSITKEERREINSRIVKNFPSGNFFIDKLFQSSEDSEEDVLVEDGTEMCKKCGSLKVHQDQFQGRSADEAATNVFLCINCGNRWIS